jgi:hypothetical protein
MRMRSLTAAFGVLLLVPHVALAQGANRPVPTIGRAPSGTHLQPNNASRLTVRDSNTNGTIIGAVIGAGAGLVAGLGWASIDENSDSLAGPALGFLALGAAAGAGVGWAADNAHHQVAHRIPVSRQVSIQPSVGVERQSRGRPTRVRAGVGAVFGW